MFYVRNNQLTVFTLITISQAIIVKWITIKLFLFWIKIGSRLNKQQLKTNNHWWCVKFGSVIVFEYTNTTKCNVICGCVYRPSIMFLRECHKS